PPYREPRMQGKASRLSAKSGDRISWDDSLKWMCWRSGILMPCRWRGTTPFRRVEKKGEVGMGGLDGRRVILTGGASGIGRATTLRLADEGCVVGVFDQNLAGAEETARLCAGKPGRVLAFQVDITDRDAVAAAADRFEAAAGPV